MAVIRTTRSAAISSEADDPRPTAWLCFCESRLIMLQAGAARRQDAGGNAMM